MHRFRRLNRILRIAFLVAACALAVRPGVAQEPVGAASGSAEAIARVQAEVAAIRRETPDYWRTKHDLYEFSLSRLPKVLCTFTVQFRAVGETCAREWTHGASASVERPRAR